MVLPKNLFLVVLLTAASAAVSGCASEKPTFMARVNRQDPLIETPLGVMRKSDYEQVLAEEKARRDSGR